MQTAYNEGATPGNFTGMSLDGLFLLHFLQALDRLQQYLGDSGTDEEGRWMRVNLQFQYLCHLLPRDIQAKVSKMVDAKEQELKQSKEVGGEYAPLYISRMEIITEVVMYLTASLDLVHEDIIAALTPKARDHAISSGEEIQLV